MTTPSEKKKFLTKQNVLLWVTCGALSFLGTHFVLSTMTIGQLNERLDVEHEKVGDLIEVYCIGQDASRPYSGGLEYNIPLGELVAIRCHDGVGESVTHIIEDH